MTYHYNNTTYNAFLGEKNKVFRDYLVIIYNA